MKRLTLFIFLVIGGLQVNAQAVNDSEWGTSKKDLTTFVKAINVAGLNNIFNSRPVTVFAPDNQAFDKFLDGKADSLLMPANKSDLIALLNGHIIAGKLTSKDIAKAIHNGNGQTTFTTLAGTKLIAQINGNRNIVLVDENGGESIIKTFNIQQSNAEIFIINTVLLPKK